MDVNKHRRKVSSVTRVAQIKVKEQSCYCCCAFHGSNQ